jgi:hypothetical protein
MAQDWPRNTNGPAFVGIATSRAHDLYDAVREVSAGVDPAKTSFVLAFVPGGQDMTLVADTLKSYMGGVPVFGCSSAGQITERGYESDALLLMIFPKRHFRCSAMLIEPLVPLFTTQIAAEAQRHASRFHRTAGWKRLGLIFADGLAKQEDLLVSTLETVLEDLPIFGGSAGDLLRFEQTHVLHDGAAHCNAALLLIIETDLPFASIGFDHFLPGDTQIVITRADPEARMVFEINGAPAAAEYARLVGCDVADLSPQIFAENPLLVNFNGHHYVRAISGADAHGALSFLAAIDDGLIMTLGQGKEILWTLQTGLDIRDASNSRPDFILGFDCVLRRLEIEQKQLGIKASDILKRERVFGFNTYGEQYCGVHMNQTFVGVAFFAPLERNMA